MPESFSHIIPVPQPQSEEIFAVHQTTQAFYEEVRVRQAFEQYCDWYDRIAEQHRQDLKKMRRELNLLRWFYRTP
jgi:hypothetical protein